MVRMIEWMEWVGNWWFGKICLGPSKMLVVGGVESDLSTLFWALFLTENLWIQI